MSFDFLKNVTNRMTKLILRIIKILDSKGSWETIVSHKTDIE